MPASVCSGAQRARGVPRNADPADAGEAWSREDTHLARRRFGTVQAVGVQCASGTLAIDPRPPGCRKLSGYDDVYPVRVGRYRVLYEIEGHCLVVIFLTVGDRKDVDR